MTRRLWTDTERAELSRRYPHELTSVIAADMGRTEHQVYYAAGKVEE